MRYLLIILFMPILSYSQNLVKNPSFEEADIIKNYDKDTSVDNKPNYWDVCGGGYYNRNHTNENFRNIGQEGYLDGNGCVGFYPYQPDPNYLAFIVGNFEKPLIKNHKYKISFWYRCASENETYIDSLNYGMYGSYDSSFHIINDSKWHNYTSEFIANGGEISFDFYTFPKVGYNEFLGKCAKYKSMRTSKRFHDFYDGLILHPKAGYKYDRKLNWPLIYFDKVELYEIE